MGTVSYEPRTEYVHSSKGRPCCLDKKRGAHGGVPSLGLDLWAPSLPWAAAELRPVLAHLWLRPHTCTCGFSWGSFSFLGQGVLQRPLLGRQPGRGFFPLAWGTQVALTLQPLCKAQPRAGSFPSPWGLPPSTYFYQTTTDKRAEGPHRNRGEKYRGPLPPNPRCGTQSSPHFLGPPVKGWSWATSARHCHLAQGKPTFQDGIFVLSSCLPPNSDSGRALPENSNTWSWLQKPLSWDLASWDDTVAC